MRKTPFLLIGMLLVSALAVNFMAPITADEPRGTRNPGADVNVTALSENQTGIPTEILTYLFEVKNTGDENDTFDIFIESESDWILNFSHSMVGPLGVDESTQVTVNITIPMGWPAGTLDNLTFRARSNNDFGISDLAEVTTSVSAMFILSMDIDGGHQRLGLIDAENQANYTLTIRNKGNIDVTITLDHTLPSLPGWQVLIPDFPNPLVYIEEADITGEFEKDVNITVQAPANAQPDDVVTIELWGEKTDIIPNWYSWQTQENITITTTVEPVLEITITPEFYIGFVDFGDTLYDFTITNSGNKIVEVDLVAITNLSLLTTIDNSHMTVDVGTTTDVNVLRVSTAKNTPLGNYTIIIRAEDSSDGAVIGYVELDYIVVPRLNITDISISSEKPVQYESVTISTTIENIGYMDAKNITVRFFDGSKKIGEKKLDYINATKTEVAELKWPPSDFGNRSIRIVIDVEGEGNFSDFGTAISEDIKNFEVEINWQPYYFIIFVIIVIILGVAVVASLFDLRYYGGVPTGAGYDDYGEGELPPEGYPDEEGLEPLEGEDEEGGPAPFGTETFGDEGREPFSYEREEKERFRPPPKPEPAPRERHPPPVAAEAREPRAPVRDHELRDEISRVKDKLYKTKSLGIDTANIDNLLSMANRSLDTGDTDKTKQYLKYANERIDGIMAKREEAVQAIKEAKEVLSGMRDSSDMTIVENFVVKADSLFEEGDFREAINYANKAKDRALRLQRREMRL
jgi:hypothetical protein